MMGTNTRKLCFLLTFIFWIIRTYSREMHGVDNLKVCSYFVIVQCARAMEFRPKSKKEDNNKTHLKIINM